VSSVACFVIFNFLGSCLYVDQIKLAENLARGGGDKLLRQLSAGWGVSSGKIWSYFTDIMKLQTNFEIIFRLRCIDTMRFHYKSQLIANEFGSFFVAMVTMILLSSSAIYHSLNHNT